MKSNYETLSGDTANEIISTNLAYISGAMVGAEQKIDFLRHELDKANRKKRRRITKKQIVSTVEDEIVIEVQYDDGSSDKETLILNYRGQMTLYHLCPTDCHVDVQLAVIIIGKGDNCIPVVGCWENMRKGKYIYQQMIMMEIRFNPTIPLSDIYRVLEEWFLMRVFKAGQLSMKLLHGWTVSDGMARFESSSPICYNPEFIKNLKIRTVIFERVEFTMERCEGYFAELNQFKDANTRLMIFISPFLGLLMSLTERFIGTQTLFVNFITISEMAISMISSWIQVFDRDLFSDGGIAKGDKERMRCLELMNDENLLIDIREYEGESEYSQKKKRHFLANVADRKRNQRVFSNVRKRLMAVLFSVSNHIETMGTINIILPEQDEIDTNIHNYFVSNKCLEAIMTEVIDFVENNFYDVTQILRRKRSGEINKDIFSAVFDVLKTYFEERGINILDKLRISNEFDNILDTVEDEENLASTFISVVRSQMHNYKAADKRDSNFEEGVIYYDTAHLYFPKEVLEEMFICCHREFQWTRALLKLREMGHLYTDSPEVLVKKMQVEGIRRNYYAVDRDWLNFEGFTEVTNLARGEE